MKTLFAILLAIAFGIGMASLLAIKIVFDTVCCVMMLIPLIGIFAGCPPRPNFRPRPLIKRNWKGLHSGEEPEAGTTYEI